VNGARKQAENGGHSVIAARVSKPGHVSPGHVSLVMIILPDALAPLAGLLSLPGQFQANELEQKPAGWQAQPTSMIARQPCPARGLQCASPLIQSWSMRNGPRIRFNLRFACCLVSFPHGTRRACHRGRVLLALVFGGLIGMERTFHGSARLSHASLVCLASALLMMARSTRAVDVHHVIGTITIDPTRTAQAS